MAPVVHELKRAAEKTGAVEPLVFVTGQHREMLDQVLAFFGIEVDADLEVMRPGHMAEAVNPYGDGTVARRIVQYLLPRHHAALLEDRRP